ASVSAGRRLLGPSVSALQVERTMASTKTDPLIAALLVKLPPSGSEWPVDRQIAWLKMMAQAFGVVYGGDAVAKMETQEVEAPRVAPPPPPKPKKPNYKFVIDEKGFVKRGNGQRVMPSDIDAEVVDLSNGAVDMRQITWADDSQGLNGADITIVLPT